MTEVIMIILAVVAGSALSMQAAVNGKLGEKVGVLKSAFLTFSVGAAITGVLILFIQTPQSATLLTVPKWQLMGALFGVPYIIIMVTAVPRIGTAAATVAVILGQLSMGMMIDNFGWLQNPTIGLSWQRMAAVPCLAIALWLIYRSNRQSS
ncbi:DMT family transporter [Ewingella americana]|uniref:DMT family transporter n=1 Tax=Ewingella americana TaxID=41202 RepID=A0A502GUP4_9GAMM|nr:DMT family transporter [Ewingella americana]TPG65182.1 DMT family transporter [Ewingella americana]